MSKSSLNQPLLGKIALVAGATRGAGRGIACMLGQAGATVYCTGRSSRQNKPSSKRPETIEETAEMVTAYGGHGFAIQADHTDEAQVQKVFQQIEAQQGQLNILVNDIWGGDQLTEWGQPLWQLDLSKGWQLLQRAIHTHIITSRHGIPLMLKSGEGLIIEITDGDARLNTHYRGNLFYDLSKISTMRLGLIQSRELRDHHITALSLTPGFLRSEAMLERFGVTEENWQEGAKQDPHFAYSETPYFVGKAVAALAADPYVFEKTGQTFSSWELAKEYGFQDIDGRQPDWGSYFDPKQAELWALIEQAVEQKFMDKGIDTTALFKHDVSALLLCARKASRWTHFPLTMVDVWWRKAEEIANDFYNHYSRKVG